MPSAHLCHLLRHCYSSGTQKQKSREIFDYLLAPIDTKQMINSAGVPQVGIRCALDVYQMRPKMHQVGNKYL